MALSIKNREVEDKARRLARLMGKPITDAVSVSLDRELARQTSLKSYEPRNDTMARIREIQDRVAKLPRLSNATDDEILGYNEFGVWDK